MLAAEFDVSVDGDRLQSKVFQRIKGQRPKKVIVPLLRRCVDED
jgi:hypothetical protein